jgi:hypothetical protein
MQNPATPVKPVLSPATFDEAVLRLAAATDAELAEWDLGLNAELKRLVEQMRRKAA